MSIPFNQQEEIKERSLAETIPCNTEIDSLTVAQVIPLTETYISSLGLEPLEESLLRLSLIPSFKYGILFKTVCASCDSAVASASLEDLYDNDNFNRYCGDRAYGSDIEHSGRF